MVSEKQPHERSGQAGGFTPNRRDVLRTAGGLVAATALAGALFEVSPETAAAAKSTNRLVVTIDDDGQSQFDATSLSFGVSNSGSSGTGGGSGAGKANFSDLSLTKFIDAVTPRLQGWVATGRHIRAVRLAVLADRAGSEVGSIALGDVLVTSDQISIGGGDSLSLMESVTFAFGTITITYAGVTFNWNVRDNTSS